MIQFHPKLYIGVLFIFSATLSVSHRRVTDHHLISAEELVKPVDKHIMYSRVATRPKVRRLVRRKRKLVKKPVLSGKSRRSVDDVQNSDGRSGGRVQVLTKASFSECGIQKVPFDPPAYNIITKVINGTCTPYGAYPWTIQIQEKRNGKYVHRCGGSLISDVHVLTAHHCFFGGGGTSDLRVVVGQYNINKKEGKEMSFEIEQIWYHKGYQDQNNPYSNDLAMIKLKRKGDGSGVRFSNEVSPICLPDIGSSFPDGMDCVISGWGQILPNGKERTECLRAAKVPVLNQDECKDMYKYSSGAVIDSMLCAGYVEGGVDACKGDSGGPLACYVDGSYKLVGVVSWGLGCGKANRPGVFTRVQHYLDWIQERM